MHDEKPEPSGRTMFYMFKVLWNGLYVRLRATVNVVSLSIKWGTSIRVSVKVRIYRTQSWKLCPGSGVIPRSKWVDTNRPDSGPDDKYRFIAQCPSCGGRVSLTPTDKIVRHKPKLMLRFQLFDSSIAKE